jgi:DMSO/TMAO reductase YedYZ molybdopterin-dependent catalytic subunit
MAHGAPLRLVAPAHYGYKNVKHIQSLEFLVSDRGFRPVGLRFMAHPRARVALQERGVGVPAWLLRAVYRPVVKYVADKFTIE